MNDERNDGGPAFPVPSTSHLDYASICGMTLRAWLAGTLDNPVDENGDIYGIGMSVLQKVFGPVPSSSEHPCLYLQWFVDVEARLRVMRADAIINVLSHCEDAKLRERERNPT